MDNELTQLLDKLRPFSERTAKFGLSRKRYFLACLKASFTRSFEFVDIASSDNYLDSAFFLVPGLRGITEDIIFLRYISRLKQRDRETLTMGLMFLEVHGKLEKQEAFFQRFRPFQPVLLPNGLDVAALKNKVRDIWKANGWPNLKKINPPTREIAEKLDPGLLEIIYDFVYRLTSGTVHFNPQVLLRSGWMQDNGQFNFSTKNMSKYYLAFSRIYGGYLLCLYFEIFGKFLRPDKTTKDQVTELREYLLNVNRWPEMVTFEEMNIELPKGGGFPRNLLQGAYTLMFREGFIRGAKGEHPIKNYFSPSK